MHLVSRHPQQVRFAGMDGATATFAAGEAIHTESSIKYDDARLDRILQAAGFRRERTFTDDDGLFGLHLCRLTASS
jgi:uncharacterized SAM-dependent methyltransferase